MRTGLQLAFYRTFAIPRIAELLAHTGEIERRPLKRSLDTGLLMYELIDGGTGSDRGREVIEKLNRMHRRWPIAAEDYRYVLTTFVVVPGRFAAEHGWRPFSRAEEEAAATFYAEVGRQMGIAAPPASYAEAAGYFDRYEAEHLDHSAAGAQAMVATGRALRGLLPGPLQWASDGLTAVMLSDSLCRALGVRRPPAAARAAFRAATTARRWRYAHLPHRAKRVFMPGRSGSMLYPDGYELADLGVGDPPPSVASD